MAARPFGARAPTDVPSTRHLTDWGRGDDQQSMFTQAYNDRHRRPHEATTGARLRAMSGADMGAALHDAPPREASCLGSSETPRPLATPWASEETVPVPEPHYLPSGRPHSPIRRRPSRIISHLGEGMQVNEEEDGGGGAVFRGAAGCDSRAINVAAEPPPPHAPHPSMRLGLGLGLR